MLLRQGLIDPNCVISTYIDGVGSIEMRGGMLHITYFEEQDDVVTGGRVPIVVARLIMPLTAVLPGGLLRWAKPGPVPMAADMVQ